MITCIKCGNRIGLLESTFSTICQDCAGKLADDLSPNDLVAMAKVGLDALIDEAIGYQEVRPPKDLADRHKQYKRNPDTAKE